MSRRRAFVLLLAAVLSLAPPLRAKKKTAAAPAKATPPEAALANYIDRVRAEQAAEVHSPGSIWSPQGLLVRLGTDPKAYRLHDVISIVVTESLHAVSVNGSASWFAGLITDI